MIHNSVDPCSFVDARRQGCNSVVVAVVWLLSCIDAVAVVALQVIDCCTTVVRPTVLVVGHIHPATQELDGCKLVRLVIGEQLVQGIRYVLAA